VPSTQERYGRGLRFPLVASPGMAFVDGTDVVAQSIRSVLLTAPGERIHRPRYGAGLRRFLFEPNSVSTRTRIRNTVSDALERDEPRISLDRVDVLTDPGDATLLRIDVRYRLTEDSSPRNLVFPFYLDQEAS